MWELIVNEPNDSFDIRKKLRSDKEFHNEDSTLSFAVVLKLNSHLLNKTFYGEICQLFSITRRNVSGLL